MHIFLQNLLLVKNRSQSFGLILFIFYNDRQILKQIQMGGFRSKPDLQKHTIAKQGFGVSYAVSHMCGWRQYMEDAYLATILSDKKTNLFAIFDGHGGAQVSTFVSRHFVHQLEVNKHYHKKNYEVALKQTFLRMDQMLSTQEGRNELIKIKKEMRDKQNGPKYQEESNAGCTANVCLITTEYVYVANAGDSRSVMCSAKGQAKELSRDHKPDDKNQKQRILNAGGTINEGRINGNLNLSRAIGDLDYKTSKNLSPEDQMITANPEITKIKNEGIEFILMGCDGIWQVKSSGEMVGWIRNRLGKKGLGIILEQLFDELVSQDCNKEGEAGLDNMSGILIKFIKKKK